ncbi:MAG: GNAT family N-acetyltransferase [Flavobacterium sp.]
MNAKVLIREYFDQDKTAVLNLLKLNTPDYFSPEEEKDLIYYLDHEIEYYFVLESDDTIVGSGGFNFSGDETNGKISWDIFHPDYQLQSLGSRLLKYRIEKLKEFKNLKTITVRTSQLVYKFYEKHGFKLIKIVEDYWAKDFHLYKMEYVDECRQ